MADRFYTNIANIIVFTAGERPSADKFNAMNTFFRRSIQDLSKAIGDIHDSGFPHLNNAESYLTYKWNVFSSGKREGRPLDIINLARLIGPASNLNPRMLSRANNTITETIPVGVCVYDTNYKMTSGLSENISGLINAGSNNFSVASSYFVDVQNSQILFSEATTQEHQITYTSDNATYYGGPNYLYGEFNVIPDPNSSATLTIEEQIDGSYLITLPLVNAQQSGLNNLNDFQISTNDEPNNNLQLELPKWITDNNPALFAGDNTLLPSNVIALKNRTTGETYTNATYEYIDKHQVKVSNVELCLDKGYVFCLVCVGTDITTSIDDLRVKWFKHSHDGSFGEPKVSIKHLADKFTIEAPSGIYGESANAWNPLANYLHRDGWVSDVNSKNGDNAMRGSLMMGLTSFDPVLSTSISGDDGSSQFIYLGGNNTSIHRNSLNELTIANTIGSIKALSPSNSIDLLASRINLSATNELNLTSLDTVVTNTQSYSNDIGAHNYININSERLILNQSHETKDISLNTLSVVDVDQNPTNETDNKVLNRKKGVYTKELDFWSVYWSPPTGLELQEGSVEPTSPDYTRIDYIDGGSSTGTSLYRSLVGSWNPTSGAILNETATEIEIYKEELDALYDVVLTNQVEADGTQYVTSLNQGGTFTVTINRSINLYKIKSNIGPVEEIKSTYYLRVGELPEDYISSYTNTYSINLKYTGYKINDVYTLDDTQTPLAVISEYPIVVFNGELINTSGTWNLLGVNFQGNTLYKIEETYALGKVWLNIVG